MVVSRSRTQRLFDSLTVRTSPKTVSNNRKLLLVLLRTKEHSPKAKSTQSQLGTIVSVVREQHSHHCSSQLHRPEDRSPPLPTPLNTNVAQADWDSVLGNPKRPKRNQFDKSNPRSQFQSSKPKLPDRRSPEVDVQAKNTVWPNTPSVFAVKPSLRVL